MPATVPMSSTFANISYNTVAKALTMGVQVVITTILARTLVSNDYGVLGVAMILIGFLGRFDDVGMTAALVQRPTLDEKVLGTAQTLNLLLAATLFLASQVAAPFTADVFKNDAVPMVVRVLGLSFLVSTLGFLPTALLTRDMRFARLRVPSIAGTLMRGLIAVPLALAGMKHWSLVIGLLAGSITTAVLLRLLLRVHAGWRFDGQIARQLLHFGLPVWGSSILTFVVFNVDNFVIGSFKGTSELGYYTIAVTWATFVCGALAEIVHSVLFPRFSRLQSDRASLAEKYERTLRVTMFLALMANAVLFCVAEGFLFTVLGKGTERWMPSLAVLQILCLYGAVRATTEPVGSVLMALGRSRLLLWANLIPAGIEICSLPFVIQWWGLRGVAVLVTTAYALQWSVLGPFVVRDLGLSVKRLAAVAIPGAIAAVLAIVAARTIPVDHPLAWSAILIRSVTVCVVFACTHELLSRGSVVTEASRILRRARRTREPAELVSV